MGLHHAEKRKKEGKADLFDHVMIVVGLIGPLSLIPQVLKIWAERSIAGVSLLSWALLAGVSFMWMIYGFSRHSMALIVSNAFITILNILIVIGILVIR